MSTDKIRFYELAKEFGAKPKTLHQDVRRLGFSVKSYMSTVSAVEAAAIRKALRAAHAAAPRVPAPTVRKPKETSESRVVRNEDGVIVGTTRRSEPKILGFIKVQPRPRKAVVQVAKAKTQEA